MTAFPTTSSWRLRPGLALFALACLLVAGGLVYAFTETDQAATISTAKAQDTTPAPAPARNSETGLPVPRFVSLKTDRVNVRRGPSNEHAVAWIFTRKGLPVEIIAEYELWRRVRDSEGAEGWVYQSLLSGRRSVIAAPWRKGETIVLHADADAASATVASVASGAIGELKSCNGKWCEASFAGYDGYAEQAQLFGVYPGEDVRD